MKRDALGGLFAVFARAAAATARKVYERLSYLSLSLFLSLVYQPLRFRNYFYVPSSKAGPRHHAPPARPKDYRPIDYGSVRTLPIERKFEKGDESITKKIFIRAFSKDNKIMETFENCSKYRDLVKERKGKRGSSLDRRVLLVYVYIYIYISLFGVSRCWRHVDLYEAARFMRKNRAIESQHGAGVIASG